MAKRREKLEHQIQRELSEIIRNRLNNPKLQDILLSVTHVKLSKDLKHARVFVSSIISDVEKASILEALNSSAKYLQSALAKKLVVKFPPSLTFDYDDSIEYGAKIEKLLDELKVRHDRENKNDNQG